MRIMRWFAPFVVLLFFGATLMWVSTRNGLEHTRHIPEYFDGVQNVPAQDMMTVAGQTYAFGVGSLLAALALLVVGLIHTAVTTARYNNRVRDDD